MDSSVGRSGLAEITKNLFYNKNISHMSGSRLDFLLGYLESVHAKFITPQASVLEKKQEVILISAVGHRVVASSVSCAATRLLAALGQAG